MRGIAGRGTAYSGGMTELNAPDLRRAVGHIYPHVDVVGETGSTNADLLEHSRLLPDRSVRCALLQTAGRGRLGRTWEAPWGTQCTFSVLYRVRPDQLGRIGLLPLAAGLAIVDELPGGTLKWPNDVLLGGRKVCGILAEATGLGDTPAVVVGCGVNVSLTEKQLPVPTATSLALEGYQEELAELTPRLLIALDRRVRQWECGDSTLLADYRRSCGTLGQMVRVDCPRGVIEGKAVGIADGGELIVCRGGERLQLAAGDVTHLRPAAG